MLFFTSGSTGRPKGVVLSHRASYLRGFQGVFRDVPERSVCMFPLFHMARVHARDRGVADARRDRAGRDRERRRAARRRRAPPREPPLRDPRGVGADPRDRPGKYDTASLREADTGTSAVPIELVRALKERFPTSATRIYYGSTEAGSGTTLPDADVLRKPGSVGPPSPGVDLRLGAGGEILLRSAYLFDGYFGDPAATSAALRDGWYHTGDLGELDGDGHLHVVGRIKELIRTGGESYRARRGGGVPRRHTPTWPRSR